MDARLHDRHFRAVACIPLVLELVEDFQKKFDDKRLLLECRESKEKSTHSKTMKYIVTEDCGEDYSNTNERRFGVSIETEHNKTCKDLTEHNMTKAEADAKCAELNQ